jgi:hypothetical protein
MIEEIEEIKSQKNDMGVLAYKKKLTNAIDN